ncbi:hypothetical protein D8674_040473 [Pyrus ussuriensis x Pyrus communis]|uniref:Uncharacterized protein n=1 Tax=Pyrus ussuriensis x Pyrus communis TaxID=2448454 RepID=A0A5N5G2T8_9ROSA|nr:hypothetical protein D8674_040473 [Pyrus ussuriensis x Pyrus communis]
MRSRRRRAKAMKIAAVADGMELMQLALSLRKKVGHATLVTVEEIVLEDI